MVPARRRGGVVFSVPLVLRWGGVGVGPTPDVESFGSDSLGLSSSGPPTQEYQKEGSFSAGSPAASPSPTPTCAQSQRHIHIYIHRGVYILLRTIVPIIVTGIKNREEEVTLLFGAVKLINY